MKAEAFPSANVLSYLFFLLIETSAGGYICRGFLFVKNI